MHGHDRFGTHDRSGTDLHGLDLLVEAEAGAVTGYEGAMGVAAGPGTQPDLRPLLERHRRALLLLLERAGRTDGHAERGPKATSLHSTTVEALIGRLRQLEERVLGSYERVLGEPHLQEEDRSLVLSVLLPQQRAHAVILDRIADGL